MDFGLTGAAISLLISVARDEIKRREVQRILKWIHGDLTYNDLLHYKYTGQIHVQYLNQEITVYEGIHLKIE